MLETVFWRLALIVKHANPCGGQAQSVDAASLAYQTDPTSAFGGIIALNREANAELNTRNH